MDTKILEQLKEHFSEEFALVRHDPFSFYMLAVDKRGTEFVPAAEAKAA